MAVRLPLVFAFLAWCVHLQSQDIHFSQFFNSPLTLNPAQTGQFDGSYRFGVIYRDQWSSVNSPFKTFSSNFDITFPIGLWEGDAVSGGLVMYSDNAGDGNFNTSNVLLSGAYHKALGRDQRLTLGLQVGYTQKRYDLNELFFADMFNGQSFGLPTNENIPTETPQNVDLNLGLGYARKISEDLAVSGGAAAFHLLRPKESFFNNPDIKLGMRYIAHAEVNYRLNDLMTINPRFLYMNQTKAQEFSIGADVGYKLQNPSFDATLFGGAWFRASGTDAIIPYIGGEYKSFRLGLSYDVNISSLSEVSKGRGGFELSLQYIGIIKQPPIQIVVPCLRF